MPGFRLSPELGDSNLVEHLGDARARRARCILRKRIGRKEAMGHDLVVGLRRRALAEKAHDIERDVIAPRDTPVVINTKQRRRPGDLATALYGDGVVCADNCDL